MNNVKRIFIVLMLIIIVTDVYSQKTVKGIVYEDMNRNNKKERKEKGIENVCVSNGRDVVISNSKGEYELPISDDNIIFVIKPSNYTVAVNEYNLPQYYYIHKPKGSPKLKYAGVEATANLPEHVNFGLIPIEPKEDFKMLLFGDPQPRDANDVDYFYKRIIKEVENVKGVEFGLSLGDLVYDTLNLYDKYKNAIKHVGIAWYNVMGNHDENYDVATDSLTDETFERNFGPANYSFNHGKVHFIILDDILYPDPRDKIGYWGGFRTDQLEFIENDLKYVPKDHLIVLAFHIPISENEPDDSFRDSDRNKLFALLKDYPNTLSLSAHTHIQRQDFLGSKEGWQQAKVHHHYNAGTSCGDWYRGKLDENGVVIATMRDGTPQGYAYINFSKNKYTIDYKVAGKSKDYQIEVTAPKVVEQNKRTSAGIYANFFMGSKNDTLMYRVDNGEWQKMNYVVDYDPAYLNQLHEWDNTEVLMAGKRPSNAEDCKHLWRGIIPTKLATGEHIIEVKAKDMFGRTFTQKSSYKILSR